MNTRKTALLSFTGFIIILLAMTGLLYFIFNQAPVADTPVIESSTAPIQNGAELPTVTYEGQE